MKKARLLQERAMRMLTNMAGTVLTGYAVGRYMARVQDAAAVNDVEKLEAMLNELNEKCLKAMRDALRWRAKS